MELLQSKAAYEQHFQTESTSKKQRGATRLSNDFVPKVWYNFKSLLLKLIYRYECTTTTPGRPCKRRRNVYRTPCNYVTTEFIFKMCLIVFQQEKKTLKRQFPMRQLLSHTLMFQFSIFMDKFIYISVFVSR